MQTTSETRILFDFPLELVQHFTSIPFADTFFLLRHSALSLSSGHRLFLAHCFGAEFGRHSPLFPIQVDLIIG